MNCDKKYKGVGGTWLVLMASLVIGGTAVQAQGNPVALGFSTFLGTTGASNATLREIAVDSAGDIIVTGRGGFSASGYPGVQINSYGPIADIRIFVAKLSPDGSQLRWVTLVGGSQKDSGSYGVDVDANDNIYVAGKTHSPDFYTTPGAWDRTSNGVTSSKADAFLFKLSSNGQMVYSTYLGGSEHDSARGGLAVDDQGCAYVVGSTASPDFLDEGGPNPAKVNSYIGGPGDGFIVKVSPDGSSILYARYVGTPGNAPHGDVIVGVRVDDHDNAYVNALVRAGGASTTIDAYDRTFNGGESDGYFAKISPDGSQLLYATYFGGSGSEFSEHRMALDDQGNVYIVGGTDSPDFPIINGSQAVYGGAGDGFLVKFGANGQPVYSTYIGGSSGDNASGPAVDSGGNVFVAGFTSSADFQVTRDAFDAAYNGNQDGFLRIYAPTGQLAYSTFLGGGGRDNARYVMTDKLGNALLTGETESSDFPTTRSAYDRMYNSGADVFVARFESVSLTINVGTDRARYSPGDRLNVALRITNPGMPSIVDLYFGALLPDGDTIVSFTDAKFNTSRGSLSDVATLKPIIPSFDLSGPFTFDNPNVFSHMWSGKEPPGRYTVFFVVAARGAFGDGRVDAMDILTMAKTDFHFMRN